MSYPDTRVDLSFACTRYDRTEAILNGEVKPDGVNLLTSSASRPGEIFWRMLLFEEFDCSEMSLASFSAVKTLRKRNWEGIPAFTARHFFHADAIVNVDSGIREPRDLEGKKVGLPEYQMSAAVWSRGILKDEYDVNYNKIHWYMGRTRDLSREKVTGMEAPPGIQLSFLGNTTIGEALVKGDLDAALVYVTTSSLVDSTNPNLERNAKIRTLFQEPKSEAIRYYKKTGIIPINHMIVLKKEIADKHPWAATNIFKALQESKLKAYKKWEDLENWEKFPSLVFLADALREQKKVFGNDPFPYGLKSSRKTVETLARYMFEQGFVPSQPDVDSLFAASTHDL